MDRYLDNNIDNNSDDYEEDNLLFTNKNIKYITFVLGG